MDFYKILENIMIEKNLTIPEMSRSTGLSDSTLRSILTRKTKKVSLDVAFKISAGLNISLEELNGDIPVNSNKKVEFENTHSKFNVKKPVQELCSDEINILKNYKLLNNQGKAEASKRVEELTQIPKYVSNDLDFEIELFAAHNDGIDEETNKRNIDKIMAKYAEMHKIK